MQEQKSSLARGGILVFFILLSMGIMYLKVYRPMIQNIIAARKDMVELQVELDKVEQGSKNIQLLTEEEIKTWALGRKRIYARFPPGENLPKQLTFKGSTKLFYGEGVSLQEQIPQLFLELVPLLLKMEGKELNLVDTSLKDAKLTISAEEGEQVQPLELGETTLMLTFSGTFRQVAEFLGQLSALQRFSKASRIALKAEKQVMKTAITIKTYHCEEGSLSDVST